ncbi:hypothetical protein [Streptomyces sp. NPDC095613]|uniref:hypothetical protein n=1 Tax=Streptomyces sp. NPDC095613 TaxID=3155540 RepID=UPI00333157D4
MPYSLSKTEEEGRLTAEELVAMARDDGLLVLDQAARTAAQYGLVHQLRGIEGIKAMNEGPTGPRQR